jgi:hypothetical protein
MKTTEMLEIERVLHSIELILDGRYGDNDFAPGSGPTNLAELPMAAQTAANRKVEEVSNAAEERAAIHCCLTSAALILGVTQRLMSEPVYRLPKHRAERLKSLTEEIKMAARAAYRAGLMLAGKNDPCLPETVDAGRR